MKAVESEGATVEQAVERALILLDMPRERVEVEIVHEPAGGGTAVVRVTPKGQTSPTVSRETKAEPAPQRVLDVGQGPEDSEQIRSLVAELLGLMGLACRIAPAVVEEDGGRIRFQITGEDAGLVIGRQGQTLDAIELVINRMVDRQWPGSSQITLDAEGYRDRRVQKLVAIAYQEAGKVRRSGQAVDMEPMSPRDRRSVHLALQDEPGVSTRSEGEGAFRHIIIEPARPLGLTGSRPRLR